MEYSKQIWSTRLLALLLMSIGFTIIFTLLKIKYENYDSQINIWTNNEEKVVAAVEELGLADIKINTKDNIKSSKGLFIARSVASVFVGFGFLLSIYHVIYCVVNALLFRSKRDDGLLDQL